MTKFQVPNWLHGDGCRLISSVDIRYVRGGMLFTLADLARCFSMLPCCCLPGSFACWC